MFLSFLGTGAVVRVLVPICICVNRKGCHHFFLAVRSLSSFLPRLRRRSVLDLPVGEAPKGEKL